MNFKIALVLSIILYASCSSDVKTIKLPYKNKYVHILNEGVPNDSTIPYFSESGRLKQSTEMFNDIDSYLLFKLNEPILSDHFLEKKIYRVIIERAFHKPIIIRIEKEPDNVLIYIKKLNKNIDYPFHVYEDSLSLEHNKIDYFISSTQEFSLSIQQWELLEKNVNNTHFWNSEANIRIGRPGLDGSLWILEGHSKDGYQCKLISNPFSPFFTENAEEEKELQEAGKYAILLKYITKISLIEKDEKIY